MLQSPVTVSLQTWEEAEMPECWSLSLVCSRSFYRSASVTYFTAVVTRVSAIGCTLQARGKEGRYKDNNDQTPVYTYKSVET